MGSVEGWRCGGVEVSWRSRAPVGGVCDGVRARSRLAASAATHRDLHGWVRSRRESRVGHGRRGRRGEDACLLQKGPTCSKGIHDSPILPAWARKQALFLRLLGCG